HCSEPIRDLDASTSERFQTAIVQGPKQTVLRRYSDGLDILRLNPTAAQPVGELAYRPPVLELPGNATLAEADKIRIDATLRRQGAEANGHSSDQAGVVEGDDWGGGEAELGDQDLAVVLAEAGGGAAEAPGGGAELEGGAGEGEGAGVGVVEGDEEAS